MKRTTVGSPITKGPVSVYPLMRPEAAPTLPGVTSALDHLTFSEHSSAAVGRLCVTNRDRTWVLLLAGTIIRGGYQNRVVAETTLVPPVTSTPIAVLCIEKGRWDLNGDRALAPTAFLAPTELRQPTAVGRPDPSAPDLTSMSDRQTLTWRYIDELLHSYGTSSHTSDLSAALTPNPGQPNARIIKEIAARGPLPGQVGIAVGIGRGSTARLLGIDLFGTPDLLVERWPSLIRSYLADWKGVVKRGPIADTTLEMLRYADRQRRTTVAAGNDAEVVRLAGPKVAGTIATIHGELVHAHLVQPS